MVAPATSDYFITFSLTDSPRVRHRVKKATTQYRDQFLIQTAPMHGGLIKIRISRIRGAPHTTTLAAFAQQIRTQNL